MVTKHTVVTFSCGVCGHEYPSVTAAAACEESTVPPPLPFKPGDEIKLKNRGGRTYTVARFVRAILRATDYGPGHSWNIVLDRPVCLDHKWEESLSEVDSLYLVGDAQAASMERKDNDNGG